MGLSFRGLTHLCHGVRLLESCVCVNCIVFSYIYLDNQIPHESRQTFGLPLFDHGKKNGLWITFWRKFSSMKSTLNHRNHGKAKFS
jgi:hypothetical protein